MKVTDLVRLDYEVLDLIKEIKCSKNVQRDLLARCGTTITSPSQIFYKLIPVTVDETIMILDECTLIYKTKEDTKKDNNITINLTINTSSDNCNAEGFINSIIELSKISNS